MFQVRQQEVQNKWHSPYWPPPAKHVTLVFFNREKTESETILSFSFEQHVKTLCKTLPPYWKQQLNLNSTFPAKDTANNTQDKCKSRVLFLSHINN